MYFFNIKVYTFLKNIYINKKHFVSCRKIVLKNFVILWERIEKCYVCRINLFYYEHNIKQNYMILKVNVIMKIINNKF